MSDVQDRWNCLKNLIRMMCVDGEVAGREQKFLLHAARELELPVENWDALIREVEGDSAPLYPIRSEARAVAALKALLLMAKMDRQVDEREKELLRKFAKSIGVTGAQWRAILEEARVPGLFEPFCKALGSLVVLEEDFESLEPLRAAAEAVGVTVEVTSYGAYMQSAPIPEAVCFHATADRAASVEKCRALRRKSQARVVAVLTRYQGFQVRYLLEEGIDQCIIEPVYGRDLEMIFSKT